MQRECRRKFDPKSNGWDDLGRMINWHPNFEAYVCQSPEGADQCLIVYFDSAPSKAMRYLGKYNGFRVANIGGSVAYLVADPARNSKGGE